MRATSVMLGVLCVVLAPAACKTSPPPSSRAQGEASTLSAERAPGEDVRSLAATMREHDAHALSTRDAVARGDLGTARREARALASMPVEGILEPAWKKPLQAMSASASRLSVATDLAEAGRELGALAQACGACHATLGGPKPAVGEAPEADAGVAARMKRHQWAADRLWDGMTVPSAEAWRAGARVLLDAPLEPESLTPGKSPVPAIGELATSVHELGRKARVVEAAVDRVAVYGELMATCSACHQRLGGGPAKGRER